MHPDSTKSYKSKPTVIDPNLSKMTKEQILKLSDSEISRYTKNSKKLSKSHHGYMPFMPDGFASPIASIQNMSKARKMNLQNHATRLAAELFSYYIKPQQGKSKKYSVSYKNSEASFFQNRKRLSSAHPGFRDQTREVYIEDAVNNIKIIAENKIDSRPLPNPMNDYSSEYVKNSMENNSSVIVKTNLPTLPEDTKTDKNNKSMPRLMKGRIPVPGSFNRQKRHKLDINKISSNLSKKDYVPRFKEGVIKQKSKKRFNQQTNHSWYQNLDQKSVVSRKIKTASGSRAKRKSGTNFKLNLDLHSNIGFQYTPESEPMNIVTDVSSNVLV